MHMPGWLHDAIFYQVYPQSFRDSNGDGIGDIEGIIQGLDAVRALGCTALWVNPCFVSPFEDAGYDVADFCRVAPRYGTNEDLERLFREAHARGLRVILDLVPGHTSREHPWFLQSRQACPGDMKDRYIWTDSVWESPDPMQCLRGIFPRDGSVAVNFFSSQPALNYGYLNPEKSWQQAMDAPGPVATRQALREIMEFWLRAGCDGFRADMAGSLVKGDPDGLGTMELWREILTWLDQAYPDAALVSEWGEPDKSLLAGFHMDFLLHFGPSRYNDLFRYGEPFFSRRGKGSARAFVERYRQTQEATGGKGLICIPSGNHDMDRLARHLDRKERDMAFLFLLTMPGAPFIYYGDEIGMAQVEGLHSVEGGYGRTGARSPFPWDAGPNAGFSTAAPEKLYIPLDASPDRPDLARQSADPSSQWAWVRSLTALRRSRPSLCSQGRLDFLCWEGAVLAYLRSTDTEATLVVLHPGPGAGQLEMPGSAKLPVPQAGLPGKPGALLTSTGEGFRVSGSCLEIDAHTALVLEWIRD